MLLYACSGLQPVHGCDGLAQGDPAVIGWQQGMDQYLKSGFFQLTLDQIQQQAVLENAAAEGRCPQTCIF